MSRRPLPFRDGSRRYCANRGGSKAAGIGHGNGHFVQPLAFVPRQCHPTGLIDAGGERRRNLDIANSLKIKTPGLDATTGGLSGGNQQKIVLGKALLAGPRIIMLDEPTRGIDTGAKQEIYGIIRRLADAGLAVLLVSSELAELIGLSDRILILREGAIAGVFAAGNATQTRLLGAAMGHGHLEPLDA